MLGQLFQGILPGLGNHFEIASLLPTKDGADTTEKIADDIAGSDTRAIDRPDDPDNTHAGAVVDGEDEDRTLFCGHAVSLSAEYCNPYTDHSVFLWGQYAGQAVSRQLTVPSVPARPFWDY